jgi:hypothetical protein
MNLINSSTKDALGWADGTYSFAAQESRHQLTVDGDGGDTVNLADSGYWTEMGKVTHTVNTVSKTYDVYQYDDAYSQLLIDSSVTVNFSVIPF